MCGGDPSPPGSTPISAAALREYADQLRESYAQHKANGTVGAEYLLDVADFAEDVSLSAALRS